MLAPGVGDAVIDAVTDASESNDGVVEAVEDADGEELLEGVGVWLLLTDGESVPVGVSDALVSIAPFPVGVPVGVTVPVGDAEVIIPTEVGVGDAVTLPRK
jgi:hypothetical protein